ncbi:MAG: phage protein Gp37 [Alphaproteobacteria bacterium]
MLSQIEQSILDLLKSYNTEEKLGYKIDKIDSYKGELKNFKELISNSSSAVLLSFYKKKPVDRWNVEATYIALVYFRGFTRNQRDTRFGKDGGVGAYQILSDIEIILEDESLGFLVEPIEIVETKTLLHDSVSNFHTALYEIEFTLTYKKNFFISSEQKKELKKFKELSTTWEIGENTQFETLVKLPQTEKENSDGGE